MEETISITVIVAALTTIAILSLWYLADMFWKDRNEYRRRLEELEGDSPKRHTHSVQNGIEDATAILIELILREEREAEYREARLEATRRILGEVRTGPNSYDKNQPHTKNEPS